MLDVIRGVDAKAVKLEANLWEPDASANPDINGRLCSRTSTANGATASVMTLAPFSRSPKPGASSVCFLVNFSLRL
jgi:hypothetical protein